MKWRQPSSNKLAKAMKRRVFARDGYRCQLCGWEPPEEERKHQVSRGPKPVSRFLTLDHVLPQSKGGAFAKDNLQTLCNSCNQWKGDSIDSEVLLADSEAAR